uniref:Uncharacterized protein n=1 Tax=Haemonchus contortus TaxID=6289 RepID=A0A7I4Z428_HAECO
MRSRVWCSRNGIVASRRERHRARRRVAECSGNAKYVKRRMLNNGGIANEKEAELEERLMTGPTAKCREQLAAAAAAAVADAARWPRFR